MKFLVAFIIGLIAIGFTTSLGPQGIAVVVLVGGWGGILWLVMNNRAKRRQADKRG